MTKFWIRWITAALLGGLALSCEVPESERTPELLSLSPSSESPSALTESITVKIFCDLHWTVELSDSSWGIVEVTETTEGTGGTVTFKMGINTAEEARENTLILKGGKGVMRKTITQGGIGTFFQPRSLHLTGTRPASVSFNAPSAWTVATSDDWLDVKTRSGQAGSATVTLEAKDANENLGEREGKIRISIAGKDFDIPVTQNQTDVILSDDSAIALSFEAGDFSVSTRYNVNYKIEVSDAWISRSTSKAPLHESIETFTVEENSSASPRSATIRFTGGEAGPLTVSVTQDGKDPILNTTVAGFYGIDGVNYIQGTDGWNQASVLRNTDGSLRYRLLNASTLSVVQLSGMREGVQVGDKIPLQVVITRKKNTLAIKNYSALVLYQKDGLTWLKGSDATYFVL